MTKKMKNYIKPILLVENIEIQNMIAVSRSVNNTPQNNIQAGSNGRRRNGWDVDWD